MLVELQIESHECASSTEHPLLARVATITSNVAQEERCGDAWHTGHLEAFQVRNGLIDERRHIHLAVGVFGTQARVVRQEAARGAYCVDKTGRAVPCSKLSMVSFRRLVTLSTYLVRPAAMSLRNKLSGKFWKNACCHVK